MFAPIQDRSSSILGEISSHWFDPYPIMDGFNEMNIAMKIMTTPLGCGNRPPHITEWAFPPNIIIHR
jgi:hypothetical protein